MSFFIDLIELFVTSIKINVFITIIDTVLYFLIIKIVSNNKYCYRNEQYMFLLPFIIVPISNLFLLYIFIGFFLYQKLYLNKNKDIM